jgi:adenosine deaminase
VQSRETLIYCNILSVIKLVVKRGRKVTISNLRANERTKINEEIRKELNVTALNKKYINAKKNVMIV